MRQLYERTVSHCFVAFYTSLLLTRLVSSTFREVCERGEYIETDMLDLIPYTLGTIYAHSPFFRVLKLWFFVKTANKHPGHNFGGMTMSLLSTMNSEICTRQ